MKFHAGRWTRLVLIIGLFAAPSPGAMLPSPRLSPQVLHHQALAAWAGFSGRPQHFRRQMIGWVLTAALAAGAAGLAHLTLDSPTIEWKVSSRAHPAKSRAQAEAA